MKASEVTILGIFRVPVEYHNQELIVTSEGEEATAIYTSDPDTIRIVDTTPEPVRTLVHERWHVYANKVGNDDSESQDKEARRIETYIVDFVLNDWELLEALRAEQLKKIDE